MELNPRYIRITNYNKLIEKFITVQVKSSSENTKKKMGKIFALIEINNHWHQNAQIGQTIINTLTREYYKQSNTNEFINFENALKNLNQKLVQITQNGDTDWIGKINAIVFIICDNKIHLSYTGKIRSYLHRNSKIMPIIDNKDNYTYTHPLKTFSSVISGDLKLNDRLFFSTNLLFELINTNTLSQILNDKMLTSSASQITNLLKSRNITKVNCLIAEMLPIEMAKEEIPDVMYLDEKRFSVKTQSLSNITKNAGSFFKNLFSKVSDQFTKSSNYIKKNVIPESKSIWNKTKKFTNSNLAKLKSKPESNTTKINHKNETKNVLQKTKKIDQLNINYYQSSQKIIIFLKKIYSITAKFFHKLYKYIKILFSPKYKTKTLIVIIILFIIILVANIGYLQNSSKEKEKQNQVQKEIIDLANTNDEISLSILSSKNDNAKKLITENQKKIDDILKNNKLSEDQKKKIDDIQSELDKNYDKVYEIKRLAASTPIIDNNQSDKFFIIDDQIYLINLKTNQIFKTKINSNETPKEIAQVPTSYGLIKNITQISNDLIISTYQKNIYRLKNDNLYKLENSNGSWSNSDAIASYSENLYLLDSSNGQIYKYEQENNNKYNNGSEYINSNEIDLKNGIDISVDGSIYVLKQNGNIVKLMLGNQQDFNIKNIPEPNNTIENAKKLYTNDSINSIFILENSRILEFNKDGNFINQYAFPKELTNISDFQIKDNKIYVNNSNKIYEFKID